MEFAAPVLLSPNGNDQRLLHCSLATVPMLRRRSPLSCRLRQGQKQVSQPIKHGTVLWTQPVPRILKGTTVKKKKQNKTEGPKHHSGVAFTLHCSQHQSLRQNSPVLLENPWPQPTFLLMWLKPATQPLWKHSLFEPRVGETCWDGRLIPPNQGDRLLPGAWGSPPNRSQFGV